jgi:hypothetical protein
LNTAYSKQINENPGFRSLLPGYSLLNGVLAMMGIPGQHTHPAVQALYDKMVKLGMKEQEHGEDITQAACEAKGYKWDEGLQACFKSGGATADEDDEVYNPYTGMV